jgi:hypothetical protein
MQYTSKRTESKNSIRFRQLVREVILLKKPVNIVRAAFSHGARPQSNISLRNPDLSHSTNNRTHPRLSSPASGASRIQVMLQVTREGSLFEEPPLIHSDLVKNGH